MNTNWVRSDLKSKAKVAFKANYWPCVLAAIIGSLFAGGTSNAVSGNSSLNFDGSNLNINLNPNVMLGLSMALMGTAIILIILDIFVFSPLYAGVSNFYLVNTRGKANLGEILYAFKNGNYWSVVKTQFVKDLYLVLWTCLFIVPGIIKMYSYRMVPYILAENPQMSTKEVIDRSRQMMKGNKWKAFVLDLSFIGWILLGTITLGIVSVFWTAPYMNATNAELYLAIFGQNNRYDSFYGGQNGGYNAYGTDFNQNVHTRAEGDIVDADVYSEKPADTDLVNGKETYHDHSEGSGTKLNGKEI
jgi:uncharacterized membrane protein